MNIEHKISNKTWRVRMTVLEQVVAMLHFGRSKGLKGTDSLEELLFKCFDDGVYKIRELAMESLY